MTDRTPLEESLYQAAQQPDEQFATKLRQRSLQAFDRNQPTQVTRKTSPQTRGLMIKWGTALAFVLLVSFLFTPPGRAFAQAVLQLGLIIFTHEPTDIELELTATPVATRESYPVHEIYTDVATARKKADFPVYYPAFLPEGYIPVGPRTRFDPLAVVINSSGEVTNVSLDLEHREHKKYLLFSQSPYNPSEIPNEPINQPVGDAKLQEVTVAGHKAIWIENVISGTDVDENGQIVPVRYNILRWEIPIEGGRMLQFHMMSGELLPLEVMLQIAESAAP